MKVLKKMFIFIGLFLVILMIVIFMSNIENIGNPKVKDVLENNPDADLIQLDGLIYLNLTLDSKDEQVYEKQEQIGEIKKKTHKTWWFGNLYATKLPKGTKVYTTDRNGYSKGDAPFVIVVELNKEIVAYHALIEG